MDYDKHKFQSRFSKSAISPKSIPANVPATQEFSLQTLSSSKEKPTFSWKKFHDRQQTKDPRWSPLKIIDQIQILKNSLKPLSLFPKLLSMRALAAFISGWFIIHFFNVCTKFYGLKWSICVFAKCIFVSMEEKSQ